MFLVMLTLRMCILKLVATEELRIAFFKKKKGNCSNLLKNKLFINYFCEDLGNSILYYHRFYCNNHNELSAPWYICISVRKPKHK